jgi:hypothetical protein
MEVESVRLGRGQVELAQLELAQVEWVQLQEMHFEQQVLLPKSAAQ